MEMFRQLFTVYLLRTAIRMATPLLYASLGGLFTDRAGIFNIALEGMILGGAFTAVLGSYFFENALMGLVCGLIGGALIGLLFGFSHLRMKADVIVVGFVINILIIGLTTYLLRSMFGIRTTFYSDRIKPIPVIIISCLNYIPVIGYTINSHSLLTYISWLMVPLVYWGIYKTPFGFHLRAAGDNPEALRSTGINPLVLKYCASVISGAFCGLAGTYLALGYLNQFVEGMSAGRGFIAIAVVAFGNGNPWYIFLASFLFGLVDGAAIILQGSKISSYFLQMLPFVSTIILLIIVSRRQYIKWGREKNISLEDKKA